MVFSAPIFLFGFLPLCLAAYYVSPRSIRNPVLVLLSSVFYIWGGGSFFILMFGSAVADYLIARAIHSRLGSSARRVNGLVAVSVVVNVGLLFWFKYAGFAAGMLNRVLGAFDSGPVRVPHVVLPLAISFFTFQRMSFTLDVVRGKVERMPGFVDYLLFGLLFPHLIAGPIVRYLDIADEIRDRRETMSGFAEGVVRFGHGLAKKVLVADTLAPVADAAFTPMQGPPTTVTAWVGALAYTFQLYFDFSGYSDMAIGLGKMFGFDFPENFNRPYSAVSITDFWRRWHISLSSWFRDYLFIPLGGSRGSTRVTVRNLAIVFAVTGLWHGAAVTFIVWGCYHGALVIAERLTGLGDHDPHVRWWPVRRLVVFLLAVVGWVVFRARGMRQALRYLEVMFVPRGGPVSDAVNATLTHRALVMFAVGAVGVMLPAAWAVGRRAMHDHTRPAMAWRWLTVTVLMPLAFMMVSVGRFSPFLYFQF